MFQTTKQKVLLAIYVFLILSIPMGAYMASQSQNIKSKANEPKTVVKQATNSASLSALDSLKNMVKNNISSSSSLLDVPNLDQPASSSAISFGPTLNIRLILEGRPANNQAAKVFIGIAEGAPTQIPKYLLSFTIDLPASGLFTGLSMAGLTEGNEYTAYIKGPAQIATSSAFTLGPSSNDLNSAKPLTLLSGDLNDDNVIDKNDYNIALQAFGSHPGDANWNELADFNLDGVINNFDLLYIIKNMNQTGNSGPWQSTPKIGGIPQGGPEASSSGGYWFWMPSL